jgi:hypothetical protein
MQFGHFGVFAGWRQLQLELSGTSGDQAFDGDLTTQGALLGVTLRF